MMYKKKKAKKNSVIEIQQKKAYLDRKPDLDRYIYLDRQQLRQLEYLNRYIDSQIYRQIEARIENIQIGMQISKLLSALISYLYNIPSIPSTKIYFTIYLVQKHTLQYTQYRNIHYNIPSTETYFSIYLVKNILHTQCRNILNTWYKNILHNIPSTETYFSIYLVQKHTL